MDAMLDSMESWQLAEWQAFEEWEREMTQRAEMQVKAEAKLEAMKRGR